MSVLPDIEPASAPCPGAAQLAAVIDARARDLGGFTVGRVQIGRASWRERV